MSITKELNKLRGMSGYGLVLLSLVNFILTPLYTNLFSIPHVVISVFNYTLIIFASVVICQGRKLSRIYIAMCFIVLLVAWLDICWPNSSVLELTKLVSLLMLFSALCVLLLHHLIKLGSSNVQGILGAISGFIFIGLIGGIIFEIIGYFDQEAFSGIIGGESFGYTYFSFSSITTVGFGDIVPVSSVARSLTIFMSILGQFYLTVVVALFVGRYLSEQMKN